MLFNSLTFILFFLPAVLAGFFFIGRFSHLAAARWLALASLFFYGWWDTRYVVLLLISIALNFLLGQQIARAVAGKQHSRGRRVLITSVALNLLVLGYYKYAGFFAKSLATVSGLDLALGEIVLPLGISFFTFTQIAFLVDCYQGKVRVYNFSHYLLFVTYFPHLIAGPVLHHAQMMPQFREAKTYRPDATAMSAGIMFFTIGLFKKVIVADGIAQYATPVFAAASTGYSPGFLEANSAAFCYAMQLYFDFSGYSDMAVGLSLLFGIRLPFNFNSPYKAENFIDFWRRWHMTLSAFLRDYLYVPLGGNRHGEGRRYVNLGATMLLGGLWHGAGWTFVVWGAGHGVLLMFNHAWQSFKDQHPAWKSFRVPRVLAIALTFYAVMMLWVVFRAADMGSALRVLSGMLSLNGNVTNHPLAHFNWVFWSMLVVFFAPNSQELVEKCQRWVQAGQAAAASRWMAWRWLALALAFAWAFWWALTKINKVSEFLYFQF
jgi:alginate O-acetyltransferase complex protein AlgI